MSALAGWPLQSPRPAFAQDVDVKGILHDPDAPTTGNPKGDVTIVAFLDYNCPFCKKSAPDLDRIVKEDGKVRLVYKDWPVLTEASIYGAQLALAAKYQGKYDLAHHALMAIPGGKIGEDKMLEAVRASGVDMNRLQADLQAHADDITALLRRNLSQADSLGLQGTPTFLIGPFRTSTLDYAGFKEALAGSTPPPGRRQVDWSRDCTMNCITVWPALARWSALMLVLALGACTTTSEPTGGPSTGSTIDFQSADAQRYGAISSEPFPVPAVTTEDLKPRYMRQFVDDPTGQAPGTIVVDPKNHFLYLVQEGGKALRYGVGVGSEGMAWPGVAQVQTTREWPRWTPTKDMIAREPKKYAKWAGGMEGGARNPLGARVLYLFKNGKDTLYRIHGTNEPRSIGESMSSGCIRMMNQDVIDLYRRIPAGTKVVVLPG